MVEISADESSQLVTVRYTGIVDAAQMTACIDQITQALAGMNPGFQLLTDLTGLERMDLACAPQIEQIMTLCDERQIATVVRVIPEPAKDIGFNIMSRFHYGRHVQTRTYDNMTDALASLPITGR